MIESIEIKASGLFTTRSFDEIPMVEVTVKMIVPTDTEEACKAYTEIYSKIQKYQLQCLENVNRKP